ncbi:MAG: glycosyltransferase [Candidatus Omnitrophota bacterium]
MDELSDRISVLIPSYNREQFIAEALDSVRNQLADGDEVLVVDDGSTDGTVRVLETYRSDPRFRYIVKPHTNAPDTRNCAIKEARNPWIVWLGSDDILMPGILDHYRRYMRQFPDVDVIYGNFEIFGHIQNSNETRLIFRDYYKKNRVLVQHLFFKNVLPDGGVLLRKNVYDRYGGYDCNFNRLHDYEFWIRTAPHLNFKHCNRYICKWRWHQGNMSAGSIRTDKQFNYMIMEKLLATYDPEAFFPFFKGRNDPKSLAHFNLQIGKQYARAAAYPEAAEKSFRYLVESIELHPCKEAYFELLHLIASQSEERKNDFEARVSSSLLHQCHRITRMIKGRGWMDRYKIASLNKRLGNMDIAESRFLALARLLIRATDRVKLLPGVYFHLGEINYIQGKREAAKDYFDRCLSMNPLHHKARQYMEETLRATSPR